MKKELQDNSSKISFTTDLWSSTNLVVNELLQTPLVGSLQETTVDRKSVV